MIFQISIKVFTTTVVIQLKGKNIDGQVVIESMNANFFVWKFLLQIIPILLLKISHRFYYGYALRIHKYLLRRNKIVTYFINTGSSLRNKSNNYRTFTTSYKSKSHCGTPIEHNQPRFRWFFVIAIGIGWLICCTFILMTEQMENVYRERKNMENSIYHPWYNHEHQSLKIKSLLSIRTLTLYSMIGFSNRLLFPSHREIQYYVPSFPRVVTMPQSVLCG